MKTEASADRKKRPAPREALEVGPEGLLRKVICEICGDETGEAAVDPVGVCAGCATLREYGLFDPQEDAGGGEGGSRGDAFFPRRPRAAAAAASDSGSVPG